MCIFGTGALALDLEPGRGLTDAIEESQPHRPAVHRARDGFCAPIDNAVDSFGQEAPISQPLDDRPVRLSCNWRMNSARRSR